MKPAEQAWRGVHVMYRVHDVDGRLIYVGATSNLAIRWQIHATHSWWHSLVAAVTPEVFPTREAAFIAESLAIQEEDPAFNIRRPDGDQSLSRWTCDDIVLCRSWMTADPDRRSFVPLVVRDQLRALRAANVAA